MEISHKLFTSWLADLTLIGSEDVIKEILKKNLQKFHSLFCKALGLLQGLGGLDDIYANLEQVSELSFRGAKTMAEKLAKEKAEFERLKAKFDKAV